jgi:hypothetical protein
MACSWVQFWEHGQQSIYSVGWMIRDLSPSRKNFCHPPNWPDQLWDPNRLLFEGYMGYFAQLKQLVKWTPDVYPVLRLRVELYLLSPFMPFWCGHGILFLVVCLICTACIKFVTTSGLSVGIYHLCNIYFVYKKCTCMNFKYLNLSRYICGTFLSYIYQYRCSFTLYMHNFIGLYILHFINVLTPW